MSIKRRHVTRRGGLTKTPTPKPPIVSRDLHGALQCLFLTVDLISPPDAQTTLFQGGCHNGCPFSLRTRSYIR